jgi:hypothetical protein
MCGKCEAINTTIARYRRLKKQVNDQQLHESADRLIVGLEAAKIAMHRDQ